jgi:hypothetical protein
MKHFEMTLYDYFLLLYFISIKSTKIRQFYAMLGQARLGNAQLS